MFKSLRTICALFESIFFIFPIMQHLRTFSRYANRIIDFRNALQVSFLLQFVVALTKIWARMTGLYLCSENKGADQLRAL